MQNNKLKVFNNKEFWNYGIATIIILFVSFYRFSEAKCMYILSDEFGYWSNAAFLWGFDWSKVSMHTSYYSWGYSLFLIPFFILSDAFIRYQAALIFNLVILFVCFLLLCKCCYMIFSKRDDRIVIVCSLATTLYSANIFYMRTTQAEICLFGMFVFIFYCICSIVYLKKGIGYFVSLGLASGYIVAIHMRSIVVVFSVLVFLCIYIVNNKNKKSFYMCIITVAIIIIFIIIVSIVKNYLIENLYLSNQYVSYNDVSGQANKIRKLFSIEGIYLLIRNVLGRFYYLLASSFFVIYFSIIWTIDNVKLLMTNRESIKIYNDGVISVFLLSAILGATIISAVYMLVKGEAFDMTLYGRYSEYVMGPVLVCGLYKFLYVSYEKKGYVWWIIALLFLLLGIYFENDFSTIANGHIREANVVGISIKSLFNNQYVWNGWIYLISQKSIVVSTSLYIAMKHIRDKYKVIVICCICALWIHEGIELFDNQAIKYREPYYSNMVIADEIKSESIKEVYYLVTDDSTGFDYNMVEVLQFMCPNLVIEYTNINEYYGSEGDYVLVRPHQKSNLTMYNTEKLSESAVLYLYEIK